MSRIIKTISLDKESDEIASKMGNFSKWVRSQLKAHVIRTIRPDVQYVILMANHIQQILSSSIKV
jgi:hypothetical protein